MKNNDKLIIFDMDGTIADLYNTDNWSEIVTKISDKGVYLDGVIHDDNSFIGSSGAIWENAYKTKDDAIKSVAFFPHIQKILKLLT